MSRKGNRGKNKPPIPKKGEPKPLKMAAIMTVPRLGFNDHFINAYQALASLGIHLTYKTGVFWGQSLENGITKYVEEYDLDWILTLDYDTIFTIEDLVALIKLAQTSDADAIYPLQSMRGDSNDVLRFPEGDGELIESDIGHFGLTMLRVSALAKLPHPWFFGAPNNEGRWGEGKIDDDIHFWHKFRNEGFKVCLANNINIGHMEILIKWPGKVYQPVSDFYKAGKPPVENMKRGMNKLKLGAGLIDSGAPEFSLDGS